MHHDASIASGLRQGPIYSVFPSKPAAVSSVQDLYEFICSGPLMDKVGLTPEKIAESIDKWLFYGSKLCRLFQLNELYLTIPQKARFYHYYIPVFVWCEEQILQHMSKFKDGEEIPPLVVWINFSNDCHVCLYSLFVFKFSTIWDFIPLGYGKSFLLLKARAVGANYLTIVLILLHFFMWCRLVSVHHRVVERQH